MAMIFLEVLNSLIRVSRRSWRCFTSARIASSKSQMLVWSINSLKWVGYLPVSSAFSKQSLMWHLYTAFLCSRQKWYLPQFKAILLWVSAADHDESHPHRNREVHSLLLSWRLSCPGIILLELSLAGLSSLRQLPRLDLSFPAILEEEPLGGCLPHANLCHRLTKVVEHVLDSLSSLV